MQTQDWTVRISVDEDDRHTHARAVLSNGDKAMVQAAGDAHRRPSDAPIPEIGDELAVARALYALADQLMEVASKDVANLSHSMT